MLPLGRHFILIAVLVILVSSPPVLAWSPRPKATSALSPSSGSSIDRAKSASEIEALFAQMESQASFRAGETTLPTSSNSSCFFLALAAVPSSSPCEALSRTDATRIEVATSWAICEIKTAGTGVGKLPRECEDWKDGGRTKVGVCVEALSRSPQHWSSYSSNLREVVTLCSSYRRWADLENARNLYASTSATFTEFLSSLRAYERARTARKASEALARDHLASNLTELALNLTSLATGLASRHSTTFASLESSLATAIVNFEGKISAHLKNEISLLLEGMKSRGEEIGHALQTELNGVAAQHSREFKDISSSLEQAAGMALRELRSSVDEVVGQIGLLDAGVQRNALALDAASLSLGEMKTVATHLTESLKESQEIQHSMIYIHKTHVEEMEQVFANISQVAVERFAFPSITLGGLFFLASRNIVQSLVGAVRTGADPVLRAVSRPLIYLLFMVLGVVGVSLARRSVCRLATSPIFAFQDPPNTILHGLSNAARPVRRSVEAVPRPRRRPSRIPPRLYSGEASISW